MVVQYEGFDLEVAFSCIDLNKLSSLLESGMDVLKQIPGFLLRF